MDPQSNRGVRRLVQATGHSLAGLADAWRNEEAFRFDVTILLLGSPAACWLGRTGAERAILIGAVFLIVIVELLNTAVEATIDRIGTDLHVLSKRAKDMSSAAVLLSLINACTIWTVVLVDRFS